MEYIPALKNGEMAMRCMASYKKPEPQRCGTCEHCFQIPENSPVCDISYMFVHCSGKCDLWSERKKDGT